MSWKKGGTVAQGVEEGAFPFTLRGGRGRVTKKVGDEIHRVASFCVTMFQGLLHGLEAVLLARGLEFGWRGQVECNFGLQEYLVKENLFLR